MNDLNIPSGEGVETRWFYLIDEEGCAGKSRVAPRVSGAVRTQHGLALKPCSELYRIYDFTFGMEEPEGPGINELPEVFKNNQQTH